MTRGRHADPGREKRGTGHRPVKGKTTATNVVQLVGAPDTPPPPPADLPEPVHDLWNVSVAELHHKGLKVADYEALRLMCMAAYRARQAAENIAQYGVLVQGERGPMVNPLAKLERDSTSTFVRIAQDFGLTFASRLRLGLMQLAGESILGQLNRELDEG